MPREILLIGGTGKTGSRLAARLRARGATPRVGTRRPRAADQVRFDWSDPTTFEPALRGVAAVYLVAPAGVADPAPIVRPWVDRALAAGVGRFVLLSASLLEEGGPMMGAVHADLKARAPAWTVLRPTWFMQNFSEQQHLPTIRDGGTIYSATGTGRVPFIDAGDIAAVAAEALLDPGFPDGDLVLTGPEPISYDEAAAIISAATGAPVRHHRLTEAELAARLGRGGLDVEFARALAAMDTAIAAGAEDRVTDHVRLVTGRPATDFATFATANRHAWLPS